MKNPWLDKNKKTPKVTDWLCGTNKIYYIDMSEVPVCDANRLVELFREVMKLKKNHHVWAGTAPGEEEHAREVMKSWRENNADT